MQIKWVSSHIFSIAATVLYGQFTRQPLPQCENDLAEKVSLTINTCKASY